jgi:O-antigen/teichoic acid export membrane protein
LNPYKKLGGQALIYGLGNVIPRLINYAVLTFYYTRRFPVEEYGKITELYAYVAILMVLLTYGLETGLFKFSTDSSKKEIVYSTSLIAVFTTSIFFSLMVLALRRPISTAIGYPANSEYIVLLGLTLSLDAISAIAFAKLRIENKVRRFASIKILNVLATIVLVFLFLEILPNTSIISHREWYMKYFSNIEIGYVFIANLIASIIVLFFLLSGFKKVKYILRPDLLKKLLIYSIPLLISGLAGIFNETIDRILLRHFSAVSLNPLHEIGLYGANYRIALLMTIFVQMFRYAAEPFFFNLSRDKGSNIVYANVLKYFTVFLMIIFLGVALCIDFFKLFIDKSYFEGLYIVPIVLMANVFVGMLFNVNMWYKITGHTLYGVYITGVGAILTIVLNILFIPEYGYLACAWIHLLSNFVMLLLTYLIGQKFFKVDYDLKRIGLYIFLAVLLYFVGKWLHTENEMFNILIGLFFVIIYFLFCNKKEHLTNIFLGKNES